MDFNAKNDTKHDLSSKQMNKGITNLVMDFDDNVSNDLNITEYDSQLNIIKEDDSKEDSVLREIVDCDIKKLEEIDENVKFKSEDLHLKKEDSAFKNMDDNRPSNSTSPKQQEEQSPEESSKSLKTSYSVQTEQLESNFTGEFKVGIVNAFSWLSEKAKSTHRNISEQCLKYLERERRKMYGDSKTHKEKPYKIYKMISVHKRRKSSENESKYDENKFEKDTELTSV